MGGFPLTGRLSMVQFIVFDAGVPPVFQAVAEMRSRGDMRTGITDVAAVGVTITVPSVGVVVRLAIVLVSVELNVPVVAVKPADMLRAPAEVKLILVAYAAAFIDDAKFKILLGAEVPCTGVRNDMNDTFCDSAVALVFQP